MIVLPGNLNNNLIRIRFLQNKQHVPNQNVPLS